MDITVFTPAEMPTVLRALRTAACGNGPITPEAAAFLHAYQTIAGSAEPIGSLEPIAAGAVGPAIRNAHPRKRLLQLAAVAALLDVPVRRAAVEYVRLLSRALDTRDPVIGVLDALSRGRRLRARMLTMRRTMRMVLGEAYRSEGLLGPLRMLGGLFLRLTVNKKKLWSYKRLGLQTEGTLGREYWAHITRLGFGFPGERGGIPQAVVYHDVGHVLTGYSTEPTGEIRQGAFQAGNRREDGFAFLQFVLLQFHQGIKITPVAPASTGLFDPMGVLWAVYRGSRCNVDITSQWDFWPLMELPLSVARSRVGLLPMEPLADRQPQPAVAAAPGQTRQYAAAL